jgi:acetyltransferase-like isoleucine patch superfamily enzyme
MILDLVRRLYLKYIHNTKIYKYCNIYRSAVIGDSCIIGSYSEIGEKVEIGDKCKLGAYVFIPKGVKIGNEVFIGPSVKFTNDKYPKATGEWKVYRTIVEDGASIGAGSTIICGVRIGRNAKVGAGSVVTKDIKDGTIVYGNPAIEKKSVW